MSQGTHWLIVFGIFWGISISAGLVALHPKCLIHILHRKILRMFGNTVLRKYKDLKGIM